MPPTLELKANLGDVIIIEGKLQNNGPTIDIYEKSESGDQLILWATIDTFYQRIQTPYHEQVQIPHVHLYRDPKNAQASIRHLPRDVVSEEDFLTCLLEETGLERLALEAGRFETFKYLRSGKNVVNSTIYDFYDRLVKSRITRWLPRSTSFRSSDSLNV